MVLGEFSIDGLLRYGMPAEVSARYAVSLLDAKGGLIAGNTVQPARCRHAAAAVDGPDQRIRSAGLAGRQRAGLAGAGLSHLAGVVGNGLFWLVGALSVLTAGC